MMNETSNSPTPIKGRIPRWLQTVIGLTVFLAVLATILYSTGILRGEIGATGNETTDSTLTLAQQMFTSRNRGDWAGTERACRELIRIDPFDSLAVFNLGYSLHRQKRLDEAAEQYRISKDFHEFRPFSLYNLACIDALQQRPDEAIGNLNAAISEGFISRQGISGDADFAGLKDDPEFQRLVLLESVNREKRDADNRN